MKVYNFGSLNIDKVYQVSHHVQSGETISAKNYTEFLGGKGLNQSIALAKAGATVFHVGTIGPDGKIFLSTLRDAGVDTTLIKEVDTASGHAIIQVNDEGNNSIVIFGGANQLLEKERIDEVFQQITSDDLILLQNEISNIDYIIDRAYEASIPVALNFSPVDDGLLALDLHKITYLFVNEIEAQLAAQADTLDEVMTILIERYPKMHVVMTLGEKGAVYGHAGSAEINQAARIVPVVDTTGAGDTFTGYFLASIAQQATVAESLKMGCCASGIAITRAGASPSIPTLQEVKESIAHE